MLEQTLGFVFLLLYFKQVRTQIGEKQALNLLSKAALQRRKSWYNSVKKEQQGGATKEPLRQAANLILKFWQEATPTNISDTFKIVQSANEIRIESEAWCPICEATEIVKLSKKKMCDALGIKADEWLARQVLPNSKVTQTISSTDNHRLTIKYETSDVS